MNGGQCNHRNNSYICICPSGFIGHSCETDVNECSSNPCVNQGTCTDGPGDFSCDCSTGFTGRRCEINIDDCAVNNTCQNGGTCIDIVSGFYCSCVPGFTGDKCQTDIDDCPDNNTCGNGTCVDGINGFTCQCLHGYRGENCSIQCPAGFTGPDCNSTNFCDPNFCPSGRVCVDGGGSYSCLCPAWFNGTDCETFLGNGKAKVMWDLKNNIAANERSHVWCHVNPLTYLQLKFLSIVLLYFFAWKIKSSSVLNTSCGHNVRLCCRPEMRWASNVQSSEAVQLYGDTWRIQLHLWRSVLGWVPCLNFWETSDEFNVITARIPKEWGR